jgi:predicted ArsR family transcriptional regulator
VAVVTDFQQRAAGIGALADPLRRDLYLYVCAQDHPVPSDEAAAALDLPLHKVKFHLNRLSDEGLLDVEFARLTGRSGPGAGRPSKLFRRTVRDIAVSLPEREYELAGRLMADAIAASAADGSPVLYALGRVASDHGRTLATGVDLPQTSNALRRACAALAEHGYEPRVGRGKATLANCPFHALAEAHPKLVCQMNLALVGGLVDEIAADEIEATLEPAEGRCCVTLARR